MTGSFMSTTTITYATFKTTRNELEPNIEGYNRTISACKLQTAANRI